MDGWPIFAKVFVLFTLAAGLLAARLDDGVRRDGYDGYRVRLPTGLVTRTLLRLWTGIWVGLLSGLGYLFVAIVLWMIVGGIVGAERDDGLVHVQDRLVALRGANGVEGHGSFFLGSGSISISNDVVYTYYVQLADGAYLAKQLSSGGPSAKPVVVFEEDREDALLQQRWTSNEVPGWYLAWVGEAPQGHLWRYEFHVPRGSILREFRP